MNLDKYFFIVFEDEGKNTSKNKKINFFSAMPKKQDLKE